MIYDLSADKNLATAYNIHAGRELTHFVAISPAQDHHTLKIVDINLFIQ